jgi:hypothetical protein
VTEWKRTPQHELNDFLQSELYHTLGSYGTSVRRLMALEARMTRATDEQNYDALFPNQLVRLTRVYNEALRTRLHHPEDDGRRSRHPRPQQLDGRDVRNRWVLDFYATAIQGLEAFQEDRRAGLAPATPLSKLGHVLAIVHDPQRRGADRDPPPTLPGAAEDPGGRETTEDDGVVRGRIARSKHRSALAKRLLQSAGGADRSATIVQDCLAVTHGDQLHTHVLGALVDAHFCMHDAEHLMATSFGAKMRDRRRTDAAVAAQLRRSLMLNTFAYVVGRALPWIFAESEAERDFVMEHYSECCDQLSPVYCVWIGSQLSLLALHRRAYTYLLLHKPNKAYNDFHKLRRLIRNFERQLGQGIAKAPGADAFLAGLDAFADHHSGRIYRDQHAHTAALRHLDRAAKRLDRLERQLEMGELLRNSRWKIELLMTQAKANYEIGLVKSSLHCYARAWRSFLELADSESLARANLSIAQDVIDWLATTEADNDIDKVELKRRIEPLVEQFQRTRSPLHLRTLAAEIMMRVGHLLFILRMPRMDGEKVALAGRYPLDDHRLAHHCLLQAAQLDPYSTLIAADLRKFEFWKNRGDRHEVLACDPRTGTPFESKERMPLEQQWPGGSGDFEEAARVVEYVLQCWLSDTFETGGGDGAQVDEQIARRLLSAFLAHTDSTNVKLAQVYRYLMQDAPDRPNACWPPDGDDGAPSVELVCLRRYSSFFPFLPRPSAFRVLGGGYFVRIQDREEDPGAFGIVVDPGPNFVDNLYRCGYSLDDVHMVIVTHNHADHIDALDALLGLLGYRDMYGAKTFDRDARRLAIVGNKSVKKRYAYFNDPDHRDAVTVMTFKEWERATSTEPGWEEERARFARLRGVAGLRLERVETVEHRDAAGCVSQGFLLSVDRGKAKTTLLFTSDTGIPPSLDPSVTVRASSGGKPLTEALEEADLVVAHVSSTPLSELRALAGFDVAPEPAGEPTRQFEELWNELVGQVAAARAEGDSWARGPRFLLNQLQFGFHSRPNEAAKRSSTDGLEVTPLSPTERIRDPSERHLYLRGLLALARHMAQLGGRPDGRPRTLLVGELREELGTFRTRIASALNRDILAGAGARALTADIGLKLRVQRSRTTVLCTTCDLDNDLADAERFHEPRDIVEVCVKGEDEGVFYNCHVHEPLRQSHPVWIERIERYDPFGR